MKGTGRKGKSWDLQKLGDWKAGKWEGWEAMEFGIGSAESGKKGEKWERAESGRKYLIEKYEI